MLYRRLIILIISIFCAVSLHAFESLASFNTFLPLDPQTKLLLENENINKDPRLLKDIPLTVLRQKGSYTQIKIPEIEAIQTISIKGSHGYFPIRLYTPKTNLSSLPVFTFFHGGGWALGDLDGYDNICQVLASKAQCLVVSVGYHLAPEYPFPIPLQDCYESVKWISKNIATYKGDSHRLAVGGDSAGGNLAAAVTLMARDLKEVELIYQVLIYPALSYQFETLSYELFKNDFGLTQDDMKCFWKYYVNDCDRLNSYASPLKAQNLSHLPSTLLIIADYDVLRDEGLAYGWRLQKAGVPVSLIKYGTIHGFIGNESMNISKKAQQNVADGLRQALHSPSRF